MPAIFISYRREDAEDSARALYESLVPQFGNDGLFMDVEAIALGSDFRQAVERSLSSCGVFLAVIGPTWLDIKAPNKASGNRRLDDPNDYVRQEIATALKKGASLPIVPVLVRGATMPSADQLPDDLKDLAFRNALRLDHIDWDANVEKLVQAVRPHVGEPMNREQAATSTTSTSDAARLRATESSTSTPSFTGRSGRGRSKGLLDEKPKNTGWWETLPGILTATAAILTVVGGLIVAFHQAGFFDRTSQKAPQVQNETLKPQRATESTIPSATKSPPSASTAPYIVTLPAVTEVRMGENVYKILAVRLDRYAPGKLSLKFDVRMSNNGRYGANFWGASFRLLVDGVPRAPDTFLDELVESHSAKEGVVEFVIPDTVNDVRLQVGEVGEGKPALPIPLKSEKP